MLVLFYVFPCEHIEILIQSILLWQLEGRFFIISVIISKLKIEIEPNKAYYVKKTSQTSEQGKSSWVVLVNLINLLRRYQLVTLPHTKVNSKWVNMHSKYKCLSGPWLLEGFLTLKVIEEATKGMTSGFYVQLVLSKYVKNKINWIQCKQKIGKIFVLEVIGKL